MRKYAAKYFSKTALIAKNFKSDHIVTLQFFQRQDGALLCGINEVIALLKKHTPYQEYQITYLPEGTKINSHDVVLELEGKYHLFGELEGIIDGILARQTSLATNALKLREVTKKELIFMGDRADHYQNQQRDGYAISLGGISTQVTDAQVSLHQGKAIGTIPHALIQLFDGNLVCALKAYAQTFPDEKLSGLVDFNNDVIGDSLALLKVFRHKLASVRVDTAQNLVDKMFKSKAEYGVNPTMIKRLRNALNANGGKHVKIIVSSGFDLAKIKAFEEQKVPVDIYGVGASLLRINHYFTADAVKLNGKLLAKAGRQYQEIDHEKCLRLS